jgi:alanine racemase
VCAELLGGCITIDDLGIRSGTIGYEILTGLGRRYHRRYVEAVTNARA